MAAANAIGADLISVDLLPIADGFTVIELNGAVDFDGTYSLPGTDVDVRIAEALGLLEMGLSNSWQAAQSRARCQVS